MDHEVWGSNLHSHLIRSCRIMAITRDFGSRNFSSTLNKTSMRHKTIKIKLNRPMPESIKMVLEDKRVQSIERIRKARIRIIDEIIQPINALERQIVNDPEFIEGAFYGKPRKGHPEGIVINHIGDVLKNISMLVLEPDVRERLRLIAIIHDTFKFKVDRSKKKIGNNHHSRIAKQFATKYITDPVVLQIIELHDDAYTAWLHFTSDDPDKHKHSRGSNEAVELIRKLGDNLSLYYLFYTCDNNTGDKTNDPLFWFAQQMLNYELLYRKKK